MAVSFKKGGAPVEEQKIEGRSAVLYGPPLNGKTSTLQYDPNIRVLLIDVDQNSGVLSRAGNVDIIGCDGYEEYLAICKGVESGTYVLPDGTRIPMDYDLYVIDSFTRFEELIKSWVVTTFAPKRSREISGKFGAQSDWQDLQDEEIRQVRFWQSMTRRNDRPVNILWIGHDMAAETADYESVIQLRLQGKYAAPGIMSAVDGLFYMVKQWSDEHKRFLYGVATMNHNKAKAEVRLSMQDRMEMKPIIWFPKWGEVFRQFGATNIPEAPKK